MTARVHIEVREHAANPCASRKDFCRIFREDLNALYQLSLLLNGDPERAESCLVTALEDCVMGNYVPREMAPFWTKRTILENAIHELRPRPRRSHSFSSEPVFSYIGQLSIGPDGHFENEAILALEDFERFAFVMSVLDHYSEYECAFLLQCSVLDIREARTCAIEQLVDSLQHGFSSQLNLYAGDEIT
jgi:hypothetical protein